MKFELPVLQCPPEPGLKLASLTHLLIEGRIISPECCFAIGLGRVEGEIGITEKLSRIVTVIGGTGNPNASPNAYRLAFNHEGLVSDCRYDTRSQNFSCLVFMRVELQHGELVAAEPGNEIVASKD